MAYDPDARLVFIPAFVWPELEHSADADSLYYGITPKAKIKAAGKLIAWDPIAQRERWHVDHRVAMNGGALATAGNLVFEGTAEGGFNAYAADSGRRLWTFETHGTILAAPTTVQVDGEQVILVPSGDGGANGAIPVFPRMTTTPWTQNRSRLLAFKLGGHGSVPAAPAKAIPRPFRARQPEALAQRGAEVYAENSCYACHGMKAEKGGLAVPDLRTLPKEIYDAMPDIVIRGASLPAGMPAFPKITTTDLTAIQAYLTNQAWTAYEAQH
jgi:quinohemoprotein ethanol dehydrogenase